jgi:hypothetical protein
MVLARSTRSQQLYGSGLAHCHQARRFVAVAAVKYPDGAARIASDVQFSGVARGVGADSARLPALVAGLNWHRGLREPWLLVAARRTAFSAPVVAFGAAPDARDFLLQQGKFRLEFHDALTMALNLLQ